ncbi:MAG: hypothetical protein KJO82_12355 [Gammaproteobacteria bacterium]|nr:hypothetical protein [Gammaproteobacteria bacterium]
MKQSLQVLTLLSLAVATWQARAEIYAPEVFRNDALSVQAGLANGNSQLVHFGDVLTLSVVVNYDPALIAVANIDATIFTSAWSSSPGVTLAGWSQHHERNDTGRNVVRTVFDFQVLACPDEAAPTCPGDRVYRFPQFEINYEDLAAEGDRSHAVRFTPWPEILRVASTMQRDAEGQLYSFETYFPAGGYPEPMRGRDGTRSAVITAGVALAALTGGLLMWPFRKHGMDAPGADLPRWEQQLNHVREYDDVDNARFVDALRRCLVWYCNDELGIDPFVWLDLAEPGNDEPVGSDTAGNHADLRQLFVELLHDPVGQGRELRARLEGVIGQTSSGRA